jgi:hypothetical protein
VDLPSRGFPNSFCWCCPPDPAVKMVNMFSRFSCGVGPHAFSIGLGLGHCRLPSQLSNTFFLPRKIPDAGSIQNTMQSTLCIGPHISFPFPLLLSRSVVTTFLRTSTRPRPESIRPLALTLGRQTESATPLEFTVPQKPTARTSHRPQHPFRTRHHHSQTPHHCPCPTTALKLGNYCQFQGEFHYILQGQMDHLRRVLGWSTEKPTIVY